MASLKEDDDSTMKRKLRTLPENLKSLKIEDENNTVGSNKKKKFK